MVLPLPHHLGLGGAVQAGYKLAFELGFEFVIRIDASLIASHSDKQCAAGNFKGGYGFHPLLAWCDNTGELLAVIARPGNAGSNTATDHIAIIDAAIAAIPPKWRHNLLITIDGAGSSHAVVEHIEKLNTRPGFSVDYSVGFDLDERARVAIGQMPDTGWEAALDATGQARDDAQVVGDRRPAEQSGTLHGHRGTSGDRVGLVLAGAQRQGSPERRSQGQRVAGVRTGCAQAVTDGLGAVELARAADDPRVGSTRRAAVPAHGVDGIGGDEGGRGHRRER